MVSEINPERHRQDFPGGPMVRNLPAHEKGTGFIPVLGRFHMQLSLCATTTESTL